MMTLQSVVGLTYSKYLAYLLAELSSVSYLDDTDKASSAAKSLGFDIIDRLDDKTSDTQVTILENKWNVFIACRGTSDLNDWRTNLDLKIRLTPFGKFHSGFYESSCVVVDKFLNSKRPNKPTVICGHSLGGAIATISGFILHRSSVRVVAIYTYGSPRCISVGTALEFDRLLRPITHRYVNNNDIVSRLPPPLDYLHVGVLHYFLEHGLQRDDVSTFDRFLDRVHGRVDDLLVPGADGIKDHSIDEYVRLTKFNV